MVEMGTECGFPLNFDKPRPFAPRETELQRKTELQPIKLSKASCIRVEVVMKQRTHSGDETDFEITKANKEMVHAKNAG